MLTSMKGETNSNTIIVGDLNTPLTPMDRSTKQKISKETQTLNDTMDQLDIIYIYRIFHPKTMNFTSFSSVHGTFPLALLLLNPIGFGVLCFLLFVGYSEVCYLAFICLYF